MRRFDGAAWAELGTASASGGGISNNSGASATPALAMDPSGQPIVAWADQTTGSSQIMLRQWNGTSWLPSVVVPSPLGVTPALAVDGLDQPIVIWSEKPTSPLRSEIMARHWDGAVWQEMGIGSASGGGISNTAGYDSDMPSLAMAAGMPVVAWQDYAGIYVRAWTGSQWSEFGVGPARPGALSNRRSMIRAPQVALTAAGGAVVVWEDYSQAEIYAKLWDGDVWTGLEAVSNNASSSLYPALALDATDRPVVAWADNASGDFEIYVRRRNGGVWEEVGTGSAAGGGVSNTTGGSWNPSLGVDASGQITVAWADDSSGRSQVYVRRWDGLGWTEVGTGSASGAGISNTTGSANYPSVAISPLRINGVKTAWILNEC